MEAIAAAAAAAAILLKFKLQVACSF